jgi:hypothetical protein
MQRAAILSWTEVGCHISAALQTIIKAIIEIACRTMRVIPSFFSLGQRPW